MNPPRGYWLLDEASRQAYRRALFARERAFAKEDCNDWRGTAFSFLVLVAYVLVFAGLAFRHVSP